MANQTKWSIDQAHSDLAFKIRHLTIAHVKCTFKTFDANILMTDNDFSTAEIDLWIDASSITTGDAKQDEQLKSTDFFDVKNHKQITFTSSTVGKPDMKGDHELWGELTIKGISKNIKLNVRFGGIVNDPWGNEKAGFTVTGKINRSDWGLIWNTSVETEGLLVSEEVTISFEVELTNMSQRAFTMELDPATAKTGVL